jgi:hypothetical protein
MEHAIPIAEADTFRRRLERELAEVSAAIELVSSGVASRVAVAGIRFGQELADRMQDEARRQGVRVDAQPWPEDAGCDVVVRRIDA